MRNAEVKNTVEFKNKYSSINKIAHFAKTEKGYFVAWLPIGSRAELVYKNYLGFAAVTTKKAAKQYIADNF